LRGYELGSRRIEFKPHGFHRNIKKKSEQLQSCIEHKKFWEELIAYKDSTENDASKNSSPCNDRGDTHSETQADGKYS
jgi:hypothetical protein